LIEASIGEGYYGDDKDGVGTMHHPVGSSTVESAPDGSAAVGRWFANGTT
jgi:hypothetical protein